VTGNEVVIPADGPVSWVSRADLAEGTARLLYQGGHEGEMLNLTGPAALDLKAVAEILGRVRGRSLFVKIVPLEDYASRLTSAGESADFARQWGTTYLGMDRGEFGKVDPLLGSLLGRPLHTIAKVLARDRSAVA
jgi:NAD(P)H dehydrogenase (quinone)